MPSTPSWHPMYFLVIAVAFVPWTIAKHFPDTPSMPHHPFAAGATWDSTPQTDGRLPSVAINKGEPVPTFMKDAATNCASPSGLASILANMKYSKGPLSTASAPNATEVRAASALAKAYMLVSPALHLYKFLYMGDMSNPGLLATPVNEFHHVRTLPGKKSTLMIQDLLPSFAVLDMSKGPVTVKLAGDLRMNQLRMSTLYGDWKMDIPSDAKTFTVAHGKKQGGADAVSPHKILILSLATLVKGSYDLKAANKFQNQFSIMSTSGSSIPPGPKAVWPLSKHSVVNGLGFMKAASALLAAYPTNDPLIVNMLTEFKGFFGFDLKNPASLPRRITAGVNSGFVAGKACLNSAVSYKQVSSSGWFQMTDISTLPTLLERAVTASSVATPNVLGLPIPDFLGATTLISKMDAKGAFLKSPLDYTFTLQNVPLGTPWSLTVVDGQTGEPLPSAPILTSFDVKTTKTSVPVTLSYKMPKTGNWLQVPNQGAAYAVVFRYMPSAQGRRSLLQTITATGLVPSQIAAISSQMAAGYNVFTSCPTPTCGVMIDPGLVIEPIFNPLSAQALIIQEQSTCQSTGSSSSYASAADSQSASSLSVKTGVKFGKASMTASSSWQQSQSSQMSSDSQSQFSINTCYTESASLSVTGTTTLTTAFIQNVVQLSQLMCLNSSYTISTAPASAYYFCNTAVAASFQLDADQFITNYGTHYIDQAYFGSINYYQNYMSQSSYAAYQSAGNSWGVDAGYAAVSASSSSSSSSSQSSSVSSYSSGYNQITIPAGIPLTPDAQGSGFDTVDWFNDVTSWEQSGPNSPNLIQLTVQPNGVTFLLTNSAPANYQQYWASSGLTQAQVIAVGQAIDNLLYGCNGFAGCAGEADGCVAYTAATAAPAGTWPPNCVSCFQGGNGIGAAGSGPGCMMNKISPVTGTSVNYGWEYTKSCTALGGAYSCTCGFGFQGATCSSVDNSNLYGTCQSTSGNNDCGGSGAISVASNNCMSSDSGNLLNGAPSSVMVYGSTNSACGNSKSSSPNNGIWCACSYEQSDAYMDSGWSCGVNGKGPSSGPCSCTSSNACTAPGY